MRCAEASITHVITSLELHGKQGTLKERKHTPCLPSSSSCLLASCLCLPISGSSSVCFLLLALSSLELRSHFLSPRPWQGSHSSAALWLSLKRPRGGGSPVGRTQARNPTAKPEVTRGLLGKGGFFVALLSELPSGSAECGFF